MRLLVALGVAALGSAAHGQLFVGVYANKKTVHVGEDVSLGIVIKNTGKQTRRFTFRSGQYFDIRAVDAKGEQVWQWSETMRFRMMLVPVTIKPGEFQYYHARWTPTKEGTYTLTASLGPTTTEIRAKTPPLKITVSEEASK